MKCEGNFLNDRICDLCAISNSSGYELCVSKTTERKKHREKLSYIGENCPHRQRYYDEGTPYMGCKINSGLGRYLEQCSPSIECEKFLEKKCNKENK